MVGERSQPSEAYSLKTDVQQIRNAPNIKCSNLSTSVNNTLPSIQAPIPTQRRLTNRKSSGTIIVLRDSEDAQRPVETMFDPGDVRAMSPRRTSHELEELGRQTRDEVRQHAKMLQESLLLIFHRVQAAKEEHEKLDNNNKFLQRYIDDLMSTSKITATGSRVKK